MDEKMKEALKSIIGKLTDEQKEKASACKDADELMKLFGEWGVELPDELADQVAGGFDWDAAARQAIEWARIFVPGYGS